MKILTFDIEEWFHILDNMETQNEKNWANYESRIEKNMEIIFEIIKNSNVKATFFVVGWLAKKYPEIIKLISHNKFEIGSHTHLHQLVYKQKKKIFYNDVERSIKTLEDCSGKKVRCFRAPGFSITENNKWAFEVLYELGIEVDSSIFPASRAHGGFKSFEAAEPALLKYNGVTIKEFPINTHKICGKSIIFSGGGYFRLLPYRIIKSFTQKSDYIMTYFHPRDFDYNQPLIPGLSIKRKFKSYYGLKNCKSKLEKWLKDFNFIDLAEAETKIDWNEVKTVNI